ncbi:lectin subunit alpha-like [Stomoxys calcitrans]|uniref:lectin subunit alpha-like n=1 Tax=Stomoxys calcitrans TaxID=35570 RepID=UPI0027E36A04|nr:lectin subunit alpha-like [Stomoxys calcitrans]
MAVLNQNVFKFLFVLQLIIQGVQPLGKIHHVNKHGLGKVYIETAHKCNWFKAQIECTRKNMSLIAVDTAAKAAALDEILTKEFDTSCPHLWIGASDLAVEGTFQWLKTGQPMSYSKWKPNMPDNYLGKEHCVHITHDRDWNDIKCGFKYGYICEGA